MGSKKEKKQNKKTKQKSGKKIKFSQKHPKISLMIKMIILLIVLVVVIGAGILVGMLYGMWGQDFEISEEELLLTGNSVILDDEGNVLAELSGDENRKIITLDQMNKYLPKAYIAIEDERFESHQGVDFKRTAAAILTYITNGGSSSFGGSTITQQVVKNITDDKEDTGIAGITRKVKEWAKAYQIERMLSKQQILELYLNIIFVGEQNYGVEVGSEYYFNKSAKDLSLVECAFLAGINNAPNAYNPYSTEKPYGEDEEKTEKINKRTKTVLEKMYELGYIDQTQYDDACKEVDDGIKFKKSKTSGSVYSYHTDAIILQVISDLSEEKGWSKEYATTYVYGGGLTIYSTQDKKVQDQLEKVMGENASNYVIKSKVTGAVTQAATAVIDNETGYVVGCYGELGEKDTARGLNRATQSVRQTGSVMKPLADLIPGIEEKIITAATIYNDCSTEFAGNYTPKNYNGYKGLVSLRSATKTSQNIPFVKVMAELSTEVSRKYLKKMGISTLDDKNDVGLSLAIGGLYNGISPLEIAAAYASIENDGVYRTPLFYTKIVDADDKTVFEPKQEEIKVCSEQTAYIVKNILKSVVSDSGGTATYCKISGIDVAAKTGTTNGDKDRWLCGFTNYYSAATWFGYDEPEEVKTSASNPAGRIWDAVMTALHKNKAKSTFDKPDGIVSAKICKKTGLKATSKCSSTYTEIFVKGTVPDSCDEASSAVEICEDSKLLATEYCPKTTTEYSGYTVVKERLGLWKNKKSSSHKVPTEKCTEHTEESQKNKDSVPTITMIGESTITLKVGETYVEKGAKAKDEKDGDITNKISISGAVNTSKAGTYTVTYTVKNSNGKETTVKRTIVVKAEETQTPTTPTEPEKPGESDEPDDSSKPSIQKPDDTNTINNTQKPNDNTVTSGTIDSDSEDTDE